MFKMAEEYKNYNEEVDDMDADIEEKEALIQEAKEVEANEELTENEKIDRAEDLRRRFRRIHFSQSVYEEQLHDQFETVLDKIYAKRDEQIQKSVALKEDLIKRAKELADSDQWKQTTEKMKTLMDEWKAAGNAGRKDDELWEQFHDARQKFYDRKHEHWEEMNQSFEQVRQVKESLIEKAKALQNSEEWKKTSHAYRDLMDEWKAAGSAGREYEDALWTAFCDARQVFYDRRNEYFDALHEKQDENYEKKEQLVKQAQLIAETESYTRENTETMKNLSVEWKDIGSCGREKENKIWSEFRSFMDNYFEGLRAFNEKKHQDWVERMHDTVAHKQSLIDNQKRQIKQLNDDMNGLLSDSERDQIEEDIKDKEKFISELEDEIADIDEKLNEEN